MSSFHQVLIGGYPSGGLITDRKPFLLPDQAYSNLQNAYVWRDRTRKRLGTVGIGRLRRVFTLESIGNSPASATWTIASLYALISPPITETYAQLSPGSVILTDGTDTFTDQGNGFLRRQDGNLTSTINYITSAIVLHRTVSTANAFTATFIYFPSLQSMGIIKQDASSLGVEQTIFFDTVYAYQYVSGGFQELSTGTVWTAPNNSNGTNTYFFWGTNYQGATSNLRFFFVTNNYINTTSGLYDPIRYYDPGSSMWTDLTPLVDSTNYLFQALILIPYYGRLLALNTWEGPTTAMMPPPVPGTSTVNYYSRVRFCQIGDPTSATAWRSDQFGKGGFLDAPTNESIVGAAFYRNTLIVFFEYSTWQLRYLGEYGLPFIFERVSSDFGSVCTFGSIDFDQGVMTVSDRGIIQAGVNGIVRLDEQIPETVFSFEIQNSAPNFVHGIRDFEKELVYWNYLDSSNAQKFQVFPTTTLLYNYRNQTWAQFRDTITCFGTGQFQFGITWDSQTVTWESDVSWDDSDNQAYVDYVLCGNQQGFIFVYENQDAATNVSDTTMFAPSLFIYAVTFSSVNPVQLTVPNHNLANGEIIYITNMLWSGTDPGLNNIIYNVTVKDQNTITLGRWNGINYPAVIINSASTYIGGGLITLFPKMNIVGKDFNPFQSTGNGFKLSYIDFQIDSSEYLPSIPATTVQLFVNSYLNEQANMLIGNSNMEVLNSSQAYGLVSNIDLTNPCVVESINHSLQNGDKIFVVNVLGTTQINNALYTISVVDVDNFSLNGIDATGWTPYLSGGIWYTSPSNGQTYTFGSQYAWYRFYSNQFGQYLRIGLTYDDILMNQLGTHQMPFELNAMNCYFRPGGRIVN